MFSNYHDSATFPKVAIQAGIYNVLRARLLKLSELYPDMYYKSLNDSSTNNPIEYFLGLENDIMDAQSDIYNEVAKATIQEQDVWSNTNSTPSNHSALLSPLKTDENLKLMIDDKDFQDWANNKQIKDDAQLPSTSQTKLEDGNVQPQKEEVIENLESDNSSLDHFFKKEENRANIFNESSKEDKTTPNISNVGLQTSIEDRLSSSPLIHKKSYNNLFQDTMNLFNEDIDIDIDNSVESSNKIETKVEDPIEILKKESRASLLEAINLQRKEYDSPIEGNSKLKEDNHEDENESSEETKINTYYIILITNYKY